MYLDIGLEFNSAKDSALLEVQNLYTVLSNAFCDFHNQYLLHMVSRQKCLLHMHTTLLFALSSLAAQHYAILHP